MRNYVIIAIIAALAGVIVGATTVAATRPVGVSVEIPLEVREWMAQMVKQKKEDRVRKLIEWQRCVEERSPMNPQSCPPPC